MGHQSAALLRCIDAGAPLTPLRDVTFPVRLDPWGRAHTTKCVEVDKNLPTHDVTLADLVEAARRETTLEYTVAALEHPEHGRAPRKRCHSADAIAHEARTYLGELDARVRVLLDVAMWLDKGQVPYAVTSRARLTQDHRLDRFPRMVALDPADRDWLEAFTADIDARLADALRVLPGATLPDQLTSLLRVLAAAGAAAAAFDWPAYGSTNSVAVVAREAVAAALSGARHEDKAIEIRLQGRGAPRSHGLAAFKAAGAAVHATLADIANKDAATASTTAGAGGPAANRLAAFTVGPNLDIPKDDVAGLAVAVVWLAADDLYTSEDITGGGVPDDFATPVPVDRVRGRKRRSAPRTTARGVAVVTPVLASAAAGVAGLDHRSRGQRRGLRATDFDVVDAGDWDGIAERSRADVLTTMMRLWEAATEGPLARADGALNAALAIHD